MQADRPRRLRAGGRASGAPGSLFERAPSRARSDPGRLPGNAYGRLYRAGYACRIRRTSRLAPGRAVLGLKSLRRPLRGVSMREEREGIVPWSRYRRGLSGALRREGDRARKKSASSTDGKRALSSAFGTGAIVRRAVRQAPPRAVGLDDFTLIAARSDAVLRKWKSRLGRGRRRVRALPRLLIRASA